MRTFYWYVSAYLRKHGFTILITVIAAIVFFSLFIPTFIRLLDQKPRYFVGLIGEYSLENLPPEVLDLISTGLTTINEDGTVNPSVAERWIIEQDGTSYRFVLKKDLEWQDGKQFQPEDINYNFKDVEVITTQNDIVFNLPDQFVPFPSVVAEPLIRYVNQPYLRFLERTIPVGLSNYRVVDYNQRNQLLEEMIVDHPQRRFIFRMYQTESEAIEAFKLGEIDNIPELAQQPNLEKWQTVTIQPQLQTNQYLAVFFNNNRPIFNKNVRQGLAYGLQKPQDETRAVSPISKNSWVYLNSAKDYAYDVSRGIERLLAEIPPQKIEFSLVTTPTFQSTASEIKTAWEEMGNQAITACQSNEDIEDKTVCVNLDITVNVTVRNFPDTNDYDALLIGQQVPADPDQYYLWHSEQPTNFTNYKNTRIDALLERGRTTADADERRAIYQEFQQFFLEDAPAIFLRYITTYTLTREEYTGFNLEQLDEITSQ